MSEVKVFDLKNGKKNEFIDIYQQFYFIKDRYTKDESFELGTILKNKTNEAVEKYAEEILEGKRAIDKRVFLWKAGKLKIEQINDESKIEKIVNGQGNEIEYAEEFLRELKLSETEIDLDDFKKAYDRVLDIAEETKLKYVGSVYLITVLFFLSKGKLPIYDYFAHRAVKALFLDKTPSEIFIGEAPERTVKDKVYAMYMEYLFLLEQVFGYSNIERELDRALWVYGHSNNKWQNNQ